MPISPFLSLLVISSPFRSLARRKVGTPAEMTLRLLD